MSFIFDQGLQALAEGEGSWWLGSFPEDVMASFAINYPAHWADTSYPPVFSPPPVPASKASHQLAHDVNVPAAGPVVNMAHPIPLTGKTITDGALYSDSLLAWTVPDTYGYDNWKGSGPGNPSLWPEYWPLVQVYGIVISLISTNVPLIFRDDLGVTSIDLAGDPFSPNLQNVQFHTAGLPWLDFTR
jgi:hypothetical protein